jgi:hypothetical protein
MSTDSKTLAQMTAEVVENNTAKGWYENCATFPEALALLHSEASEALDAWRKWGLDDATQHEKTLYRRGDNGEDLVVSIDNPKPEGVGSEFADIFIRLLDDAWLFGQVDLEPAAARIRLPLEGSTFPADMNTLHDLISAASRDITQWGFETNAAAILVFLRLLCGKYAIDLEAEYERKMQYNRTRPYRHGGKAI